VQHGGCRCRKYNQYLRGEIIISIYDRQNGNASRLGLVCCTGREKGDPLAVAAGGCHSGTSTSRVA